MQENLATQEQSFVETAIGSRVHEEMMEHYRTIQGVSVDLNEGIEYEWYNFSEQYFH